MTLEDRDLLQFNASIIAGALIFLTISAFVTTPDEQLYRLFSQGYGLIIVLVFIISSWFLVNGKRNLGMRAMFYGLGWTGFAAIVLFVLTILNANELLK
ncbi:MAG: hypothetical protein WAL23_06510 [Nitrososphaeraceae archaeon]